MHEPKVVIAVLNWNGVADTLECLESLRGLRYPNFTVLVVDNGSQRPEADEIAPHLRDGSVIRCPRNLGYAGGNNVAIRRAVELNADYIWLLNNDTVVEPDCLERLVSVAESRPRLGLISPVVYDYQDRQEIKFAGTVLDFAAEERRHLRSLPAAGDSAPSVNVALWGTALLIRRDLIHRVGLLDERYFAYVEDMDYSVRALGAGFETMVVSDAVIYHKESRSLGGLDAPPRRYLMTRNFYLFWRSHLRGWRRFTYPARYLGWVLEHALTAKLVGNASLADHTLTGAWNAFRGHWGSWDDRGEIPPAVRRFIHRWLLGWHPYLLIHLLRGRFRPVIGEAASRLRVNLRPGR